MAEGKKKNETAADLALIGAIQRSSTTRCRASSVSAKKEFARGLPEITEQAGGA